MSKDGQRKIYPTPEQSKVEIKIGDLFYCKNGGPLMMVKGVASSFGDGSPSTLHLVWFNADNDIENVTMPIECLITEKDAIAKWEAERADALERGKKKFVDSIVAGAMLRDEIVKEPS